MSPAHTPAAATGAKADAPAPAPVALPSGGTAADRISDRALASEAAGSAAQLRIALNLAWTLICGFLVMFLQAGFAMVETGFCRAKNASHTMAMNLMIYCIGLLAYWVCGYALQTGGLGGFPTLGGGSGLNCEVTVHLFGKAFGLFGAKGFFLGGPSLDPAVCVAFLFQAVFMNTAATIPTGAMTERLKFSAFVAYGFFMCGLLYPLFANWVWGGGWLSQLGANFNLGHGFVDFAGSSVVHLTGGVVALAGAKVLGPRLGKFNKDGSPNPIPGHHIPMAIVGTLILAFGWFGFTAGSTLAASDLRIGVVAVNTMLASAAGGFVAMLFMWVKYGKPDLTMSANGLLAGLVAVTAPCAFVTPFASVVIGSAAGVLCCISIIFVERTLRVDDPVGAISVHGLGGAWGAVALGLFADGSYGGGLNGVKGNVRGLFYGDGGQLAAQCVGVAIDVIFVFFAAYLFFRLLDRFIGMRVASDVEREGLDQHEIAVAAYPEFNLRQLPFGSGITPRPRQ
ncbi:ammonium transporter [Geomonas sp. Red875]|uniref:Ammonium transporter n=1 Tax=Geomesophilobacter sediminis TaxID=2798584 RepID=A0A8J7J7E6_9BACT|nr:ammonium transporter [Geomesophilobacter sediminis]